MDQRRDGTEVVAVFVQLESDRAKLSSVLKTIGDHMVVFLDYREKYHGMSGRMISRL